MIADLYTSTEPSALSPVQRNSSEWSKSWGKGQADRKDFSESPVSVNVNAPTGRETSEELTGPRDCFFYGWCFWDSRRIKGKGRNAWQAPGLTSPSFQRGWVKRGYGSWFPKESQVERQDPRRSPQADWLLQNCCPGSVPPPALERPEEAGFS